MEEPSFISPQQLKQTLLNYNQDYTLNTTNHNINQEIQYPPSPCSDDDFNSNPITISLFFNPSKIRKTLHRCRSSPAMTVMHDTKKSVAKPVPNSEARIDKRHRRIAKWVLHREITVEDLVAADLNHNGFIRYFAIF
uniref:Uncharacterized protein n=1 Tax=Daucus carota subsp. sativus TaxID=79200 RepID=A0A164V8K0_DAUCS